MHFFYDSPIFTSKGDAIKFLIDEGFVFREKSCIFCEHVNSMKLTQARDRIYYRCSKSSCRKTSSIYKLSEFHKTKLPLKKLLYAVRCYLCNFKNFSFVLNSGISEPAYIRVKNNLIKVFKMINDDYEILLGGEGVRVHVDETVVSRLGTIVSPSSSDDNIPGTQWLFGGVDESDHSSFFIELIPNRQIDSLTESLRKYLREGSILVSDGYPSYPGVARNLNLSHIVVNHNEGFRNEDGYTTNAIENLWSHLKLAIKGRHGVMRSNMKDFLIEFSFRKRNLENTSLENINSTFLEILKYIFF